jgi:hypothetical protein
VLTGLSTLTELADAIRAADAADRWNSVHDILTAWAAGPRRHAQLRSYLRTLPDDEASHVVARSKEATTHFAWCLLDREDDPFSLWLHEYKPNRSWLPGYADSVHNHRYHFCTTLLSGGYLHERFTATVVDERITSVTRDSSTRCVAGDSGVVLSHEFHRIPHAEDGTMTFLVKSRMVAPWSLSYDPTTGLSQRHIPMGERLTGLAGKL